MYAVLSAPKHIFDSGSATTIGTHHRPEILEVQAQSVSAMESHHSQPSMQSLLHSPSPVDSNQDILQPQSSPFGGTYIPLHNDANIPFNTWSQFGSHSHTSELQEKVQTLGELRLPQDTTMDNSTPLSRFMTDNTSSRPLVELNSLSSLNNPFNPHTHGSHLSIATSWDYQPSYHDSADASSAVSSVYETTSWSGSPDEHHFQDVNYDTSAASPDFHRRRSRGGSHSHRSSIDGPGCLSPSSLGVNGGQQWRRTSIYSADSNADITSAVVTPLTITSGHRLSQDSSFVTLKNIQLSPQNEEKDEEDSIKDGLLSHSPHSNSIPGIYVNGHEHSDHEHDQNTSTWDTQSQYYTPNPMEIECSSPSPPASPHASPRSATMLEAKRERRRSRSGSGASQLSAKTHAELMKPYKDTSPAGKSHKGRGAGKKTKERQYCPEHPNKMFRHNSDFRKHMQTKHTRPFLCTFYFANCTQTFGSKNEWKRHVFSQHLQLHYWRCDYPDCADRKAFFNRKDLFGQHLKRMHSPKTSTPKNSVEMKNWLGKEIPQIQERCRKERRTPPEWSKCGYCTQEFSGPGSWDLRMEHVGKHYEKNNYKDINPEMWVMDEGLIEWSIKTKIVEKTENGEYKLLCHGKDSIEGEERRKSQVEPMILVLNDDEDEEDAEGEDEDDY